MELEKWMELILEETGLTGLTFDSDPALDFECLFAYKKGKNWEFNISKHKGGINIYMTSDKQLNTKSLKNAVNFIKANI